MLKHGCTAASPVSITAGSVPTMPDTLDESTGLAITASSALVDSGWLEPRKRPCDFLTPEQRFRLDEACRVFEEAFDFGVYLVGSVRTRPDFRDVDVRAIVADETFAKLYPTCDPKHPQRDTYWALSMAAFSLYLRESTGLPIDFQAQQQTAANEEFPGTRSALGLGHVSRRRRAEEAVQVGGSNPKEG